MAINRKKVIQDLSQIKIAGSDNGLIEGFGVLVNQLPAYFWNSFADRLTAQTSPDLMEATEFLLLNAAQECGYHTGYGIITSQEWKAVVQPMVEKVPEDILHGAFAVLAAFGWANSEIIELIPGEMMRIRAYTYYETDVVRFGHMSRMSSYLLRGISAAFMGLAYGGEYNPKGGKGMRMFKCEQIAGIECGDQYGEFIVTRA